MTKEQFIEYIEEWKRTAPLKLKRNMYRNLKKRKKLKLRK